MTSCPRQLEDFLPPELWEKMVCIRSIDDARVLAAACSDGTIDHPCKRARAAFLELDVIDDEMWEVLQPLLTGSTRDLGFIRLGGFTRHRIPSISTPTFAALASAVGHKLHSVALRITPKNVGCLGVLSELPAVASVHVTFARSVSDFFAVAPLTMPAVTNASFSTEVAYTPATVQFLADARFAPTCEIQIAGTLVADDTVSMENRLSPELVMALDILFEEHPGSTVRLSTGIFDFPLESALFNHAAAVEFFHGVPPSQLFHSDMITNDILLNPRTSEEQSALVDLLAGMVASGRTYDPPIHLRLQTIEFGRPLEGDNEMSRPEDPETSKSMLYGAQLTALGVLLVDHTSRTLQNVPVAAIGAPVL
jgi:hypothetical protein